MDKEKNLVNDLVEEILRIAHTERVGSVELVFVVKVQDNKVVFATLTEKIKKFK